MMPLFGKPVSPTDAQVEADKRSLRSIESQPSLRVVDGTLLVDAGDVEETMRSLQKTARKHFGPLRHS